MHINTELTVSEYTKLMLVLTYRNPIMLVLSFIGLFNLFFFILFFLGVRFFFYDGTTYTGLIFGILTIYAPISVFLRARKSYTNHLRLQEKIAYDFTDEKIITTGDSFYGEKDWTKIFKIKETSDFFLIYETPKLANIIPKRCMTSDECNELSKFLLLVKMKHLGIK